MVTATPDTLDQVLGQIVEAAAKAAAVTPEGLRQVFDKAGRALGDTVGEAEKLPADALTALRQLIDPPDWASLLVLILVKVSELDPDHLSVGSMKPEGWSRTLTLTYTLEAGRSVTVGFAMTDPASAKHVVVLTSSADLAIGPIPLGPLSFSVASQGDALWQMAFSGGLEKPAELASLDADLFWDPQIRVGDATAGLNVGTLRLTTALSTKPGAPLYVLTLGLGDGATHPAAEAKIDLGKLLGALGAIVHIAAIDQSYSPKLTLTQGAGPQFNLGEASSA